MLQNNACVMELVDSVSSTFAKKVMLQVPPSSVLCSKELVSTQVKSLNQSKNFYACASVNHRKNMFKRSSYTAHLPRPWPITPVFSRCETNIKMLIFQPALFLWLYKLLTLKENWISSACFFYTRLHSLYRITGGVQGTASVTRALSHFVYHNECLAQTCGLITWVRNRTQTLLD